MRHIYIVLFLALTATLAQSDVTGGGPLIWSGTQAKDLSTGGVRTPKLVLPEGGVGTGTDLLTVEAPAMGASYTLKLPNAVAGTASDWVLGDTSGVQSFSSTSTTAKIIDVASNTTPLTLTGDTSQTADLFTVENSAGADSLVVNGNGDATGANVVIRGTITNDDAAAVFVGEYKVDTGSDACSTTVTRTVTDTGIALSPGDWDISALCTLSGGGGSQLGSKCGISTSSGDDETGYVDGSNVCGSFVTLSTSIGSCSVPAWRVSITTSPTYYLKVKCFGQANTVVGRISARRIR